LEVAQQSQEDHRLEPILYLHVNVLLLIQTVEPVRGDVDNVGLFSQRYFFSNYLYCKRIQNIFNNHGKYRFYFMDNVKSRQD
jgi:hypothetical protein